MDPASDKKNFLIELRVRGLTHPVGMHWSKLHRMLVRFGRGATDGDSVATAFPSDDLFSKTDNPMDTLSSKDKCPNPLILGGSIASDAVKHEQLIEQLDWAERHGCLDQALNYLKKLNDSDWNKSQCEKWSDGHPRAKGDL